MQGGEDITAVTLVRFYGVHVWVLPLTLLAIVGIHLYLVIRTGISAPPKKED
jgi:ubiquinol-cytochrome c reductase cytochrome b subunit